MTKLRVLYNGVIWGLFGALLAWQSTWLQMRIALGWFVPLIAVIVYLCYLFYGRHLQQNWAIFRFTQTLMTTIVLGILLLLIYHWQPLLVVLGATVRELFHTDWTLARTAYILLGFLGFWLVVLAVDAYRHPVAKLQSADNFKQTTLQSKVGLVVTVLFLLALVAGYYLIPGYHHFITTMSSLLVRLDISALRDYINSFGMWGPLISTLLMIFQSLLAPLPAFVLTFANAYLYGWYWGAALSWSSAMLGALLCFYIARGIGRPFAEKLITKNALDKMDHFFAEYGDYTIVVLRLLPFVSFDEVSYGAGFTDIRVNKFLIATGIGQLPATIVYSFVGGSLGGSKLMLFMALIGVILLIVVSLFVRKILLKRQAKRQVGV